MFVGALKRLRQDAVETLESLDLKAVAYDVTNLKPPVVVVVPHDQYILPLQNTMTMTETNAGMTFLVVASKGTNASNADQLDDMLESILYKLYHDTKAIVEFVTGPGIMMLDGNRYFGSVISMRYPIELEGSI